MKEEWVFYACMCARMTGFVCLREQGFRINCSGIKADGYNLQQNIHTHTQKKKAYGKMHE